MKSAMLFNGISPCSAGRSLAESHRVVQSASDVKVAEKPEMCEDPE